MAGLVFVVEVAGFATIVAYSWLMMLEPVPVTPILFPFLGISGSVCAALIAVWCWWIARPLERLQRAIDAGTPVEQLDRKDVKRALRLDARTAGSLLVAWGVPALLFLPMAKLAEPDRPLPCHPLIMGLTNAVLVAVCAFYAFALLQRTRVAPILLAPGTLEHIRPFRPLRVADHIVMIVLPIGVAMPASVATLVWSDIATPALVLFLSLAFLSTTMVVCTGVMFMVSREIGLLRDKMEAVRRGDLSSRAEVGGLDTLGDLASDFNSMVEGLLQRERIRDLFGRYVTRQVADEILAGRVTLGGEVRVATVLFADIRGFTAMSERMGPAEVVAFLNCYFNGMVRCVLDEGGVLDKFMGDGVMAVFGTPVSRGEASEDARAAVRCARAMSRWLDALNEERIGRGEVPIEIGIGVHTGELVAGSIGSPERMEYTVVGDTVNTCSRLEGLTKSVERRILVSDATAAMLDGTVPLEELQPLPVRGRIAPIKVFAAAA